MHIHQRYQFKRIDGTIIQNISSIRSLLFPVLLNNWVCRQGQVCSTLDNAGSLDNHTTLFDNNEGLLKVTNLKDLQLVITQEKSIINKFYFGKKMTIITVHHLRENIIYL